MRFASTVLILMALVEAPSHAATVIGAGVDPCARWTADTATSSSPQALQDEQWVLGNLSAVGQHGTLGADPLKGANAAAAWTWIDNYCRTHPTAHIADAAEAFSVAHRRH